MASEWQLDLIDGKTEILNLGAEARFARTDVEGMYQEYGDKVRVLKACAANERVTIADVINVFPSEPLPPNHPETPYAFQRLSAVPCEILADEEAVRDFVRKQR